MYIDITIDLKHYNGSVFDLRLSDYHPVKKVIDIAWHVSKTYLCLRAKGTGSEW